MAVVFDEWGKSVRSVITGSKTTILAYRMPDKIRKIGQLLYPDTDHWRPQTREDCEKIPRPCPYVGCRFNLYLEAHEKRDTYTLFFPHLEPDEMPPGGSCALDVVAERGDVTLAEVGHLANVTRERVRQVEETALLRLDSKSSRDALLDREGPVIDQRRSPWLTM